MTTPVYDFPQDWYQFASATFRLQARSLVAARVYLPGKNVKGPYAHAWVANFTLSSQVDPVRQQMAAFFSRLGGQAGLLRIADPSRLRPWYDRSIINAQESTWTDGSKWSDGSFWTSSFLPPNVYVAQAASKGDNTIVLGGFPDSTAGVLTRGDLLQVCPNGIPGSCPNLYETMVGGASNGSGQIGVEVRPALRMNLAVGDLVSLRYPSTVFRMVDDDQGVLEVTPPVVGNGGFQLIEALDQVP